MGQSGPHLYGFVLVVEKPQHFPARECCVVQPGFMCREVSR
jgi:hypothetical protein